MSDPSADLEKRGLINALRTFVLVGGAGFSVDATLLTILTRFAGWTPWHARIPSALSAIVVTWLLNRRYTFPGRGLQRLSMEAASYLAIQACSTTVNLAAFGASLVYFPRLRDIPVVALAVGAAIGLAFNFAACNFLLYSRPRAALDRSPS